MKTKKPRIFTKALAKLTRIMCENLYNEGGADKVYDYANKIKLRYNPCIPCEADTPTISDRVSHTCAVCGTEKHGKVSYKVWTTVEKRIVTLDGEEIFENLDEDTQSAGEFNTYEKACKQMNQINETFGGDFTE